MERKQKERLAVLFAYAIYNLRHLSICARARNDGQGQRTVINVE
jgi:hypothetical protein